MLRILFIFVKGLKDYLNPMQVTFNSPRNKTSPLISNYPQFYSFQNMCDM